MQRLRRADGHEQWVVRQPVKFSAFDNAPLTRAPTLGEHPDASFDATEPGEPTTDKA